MSNPAAVGGAVAAIRPRHVAPVAVRALAEALGVAVRGQDATVTGVTLDSRAIREGDLYAAIPGSVTHGAQYVEQARQAGARAILTDPAGADRAARTGLPVLTVGQPRKVLGLVASIVYGEPTRDLRLLGVTGTNGKTTTTYLLDAVLRRLHDTALVGTIETRIGDDVVPSVRTTPEATDLQALFAVMRERGVTRCAMEVSSHALAMGRVDGARFAVAGFTNLSQDHLDFHADLEDYFAAKASLFTKERCDVAVVNVDDPYGARLAAQVDVDLVTVSPSGTRPADWRADHPGTTSAVAGDHPGPMIGVGPAGERVVISIALPGEFNVANALLATAMLRTAGVPLDAIAEGLREATVPGRMELFRAGDGPAVIVDYAHTPDAIGLALRAARTATTGRLISVVGCGGDRDRGKRPAMGAAAANNSDVVIVTDDNPRSEDPAAIRAAAVEGAKAVGTAEVVEIGDRRAAIAAAIDRAGPDDTVVVLGKGHETGQEIAGVVHPFDDRQTVRDVLERIR